MTDLSTVHNPYDFANPVSNANLFVGRTEELADIRYYLDHAKTSPRPINIALLGPRASGKTSLLNMCELEAKQRDFCTVRIDLDEGDIRSELSLFFKLFDGILSAACDLGAFGGKTGTTYQTYLDVVNSYAIPEDKAFCPFLFPLQYARAMASGNANAQLSDHSYKADLAAIRAEAKRPILILFDEGNVLAKSRVHLEKLRNIFMNTPGFMLVMTGTPDLFPVIDDVFSPIVRQFKKIRVESFKNREETRECIRKPLESIGAASAEIFDFETLSDIREIHNLSAGRPYEIQLICHMLFRNVQEKRAKKMKLSLDILEDVRRELETSQDLASRPILAKIRALSKDHLSALGLLCLCDGRASFEQTWALHFTFHGSRQWTKSSLERKFNDLLTEGVLENNNDKINFKGDEFDKIYTKYFAREQKVPLVIPLMFPDFSPGLLLSFELISLLEDLRLPHFLITLDRELDPASVTAKLADEQDTTDVFAEDGSAAGALYPVLVRFRQAKTLPIVAVAISFSWATVRTWVYSDDLSDPRTFRRCLDKLRIINNRATKVGGNATAEPQALRIAPSDLLAEKVERTENAKIRLRLADYHMSEVHENYPKDPTSALFHARLASRYNPNPDPNASNNLGYVFLSAGELDRAREFLEKAIDGLKDGRQGALPRYNLGILEAKIGRLDASLQLVESCIERLAGTSEADRRCMCLFLPRAVGGQLSFNEVMNPDLLATASKARDALKAVANRSQPRESRSIRKKSSRDQET